MSLKPAEITEPGSGKKVTVLVLYPLTNATYERDCEAAPREADLATGFPTVTSRIKQVAA